ncbi:unnamed protein product [Somion occarium]|uniref:C2H2-type domain-containing protein n=1 Tax=Somion occarium TaxID=3059160 RepID=A0ABP1CWT9_9APHY
MNNGEGSQSLHERQLGLQLPPETSGITPERHAENWQRIQWMRNYVDEYERRNQAALDRWYAEQQRVLEDRVAAGRQAEHLLSQLQATRNESGTTGPPSPQARPANHQPVAGPSTSPQLNAPVVQASSSSYLSVQNISTGQRVAYAPHPSLARGGYPTQSYEQQADAAQYSQPGAHPTTTHYPQWQRAPVQAKTTEAPQTAQSPELPRSYYRHAGTPATAQASQPIPLPRSAHANGISHRVPGRPSTSARQPPSQSATKESVVPQSINRQSTEGTLQPLAFAHQLVEFCATFKQEIQDEIVRRLMNKMKHSLPPNYRLPFASRPLDLQDQTTVVAVMAQLENKLNGHSLLFLTAVDTALNQLITKPKPSSGQIPAKVAVREYLVKFGLPPASTASMAHRPRSATPQTSSVSAPVQDLSVSEPSTLPRATTPTSPPQPSYQPISQQPTISTVSGPSIQTSISQAAQAPPKPSSPRTPAKADRSRLAHDILRSLGRASRSSPSAPVIFPQTFQTQTQAEDDAKGKRKRADSNNIAASLPDKKQKMEEGEKEGPNQAEVSETVPRTDHISEPSQPAYSTPPSSSVRLSTPTSPELLGEIKTAGALQMEMDLSETRSHAMNLDGIQHTGSSSAPISVASGPPTSGTMTPEECLPAPENLLAQELPPEPSLEIPVAPESTLQTSESVASTSNEPLFLPSDDEDDSGMLNHELPGPSLSDEFILDTSLLPSVSPMLDSTNVRATMRGTRMVLSDDELDLLSERRARSKSLGVQAAAPPHSKPSPRPTNKVYVEAPPLPLYVKFLQAKKEEKREALSVTSSASEAEAEPMIDEPTREKREQEGRIFARNGLNRLRRSPCLWASCDAVLESPAKLIKHAVAHAKKKLETGIFRCEWTDCTEQFSSIVKLVQHTKQHAQYPVTCPCQGCSRSFLSQEELARHFRSRQHRNVTQLKPEASLIRPDVARELPPLPPRMPSYRSVPRHVKRLPIEVDHHYTLGARVLANILCYAPPGTKSRQTAPLRNRRQVPASIAPLERVLRQGPEEAKRFIQQKIEEQNLRSTVHTGPEFCNNLPSEWVTRLVERGVIFEDPNAPEVELSDTESSASDVEDDAGAIDVTPPTNNDEKPSASGAPVMDRLSPQERVYSVGLDWLVAANADAYGGQGDRTEDNHLSQPQWTPLHTEGGEDKTHH